MAKPREANFAAGAFRGGPAQWAAAKLVRYADDVVVLPRYQGSQLIGFIEMKLETWLGLEINRTKREWCNATERRRGESGLSELHVPLLYYDDLKGLSWRYSNVFPSEKALKRERDKLHEMTDHRQCF